MSGQSSTAAVSVVRHEYDNFVGELRSIELGSQASVAEYLALRNDARSISAEASNAAISPSAANEKAAGVSLQLDRSPLYGSLGDTGWATVAARVTANLDSLDVSPTLAAQTIQDMKAVAVSAGVSSSDFQTFTRDFDTLQDGESYLNTRDFGIRSEDPNLYYTQHLRGFFRDFGVNQATARATLHSDLKAVGDPTGLATRDTSLLERLDAPLATQSATQLDQAYLAAFGQGLPTAATTSQVIAALGGTASVTRVSQVKRLVGDIPALDQALPTPAETVGKLVGDVEDVVNSGGGETANPFNVTVYRVASSL